MHASIGEDAAALRVFTAARKALERAAGSSPTVRLVDFCITHL